MRYSVERSLSIDASVEKVQSLVGNFHSWNSWSPWTVIEPTCQQEISGEPGQTGHRMEWDGEVIGSGSNTLDHVDDHSIHYKLEFLKPFKSKADVSIKLDPEGQATRVTWSMHSRLPFFLFFMLRTIKNMIGMDYDRGLRMLKEVAEKGKLNASTINSGVAGYEGFSYVGLEVNCSFEEMPGKMADAFKKIVDDVVHKHGKGARHWVCIYPKFDMKTMDVTFVAAISDEDIKASELGPEYISGSIASGRTLEIKHDGSYEFLGNAWSMGFMQIRAKKHKSAGHPFEQYWNSPYEVKPEELKTSIYFPVK